MRDVMDRSPSDMGDGGIVLNMFARAKTGQLSLMDTVQIEQPIVETADPVPAGEEAPIEAA